MALNPDGVKEYVKKQSGKAAQGGGKQPQDPRTPAGLSQEGVRAYQQGVASQRALFAQDKVRSGEMTSREAADWYTGRNDQGPENGWDSKFTEKYWNGWTKALEEGNAANYFDKGTGVVTWDHKTKSGNDYKFGDIVEDGKVVGNVYKEYDDDQAALMMSPWLLTAQEQARAFKQAQKDENYDELKSIIADYKNKGARAWKDNQEKASFQKEVTERAEDSGFAAGATILNVLGSTVAGAAMGSPFGGVPGALVGGAAGFVTSLMNRDQFVEQSARGVELVQRSYAQNKKFGDVGATFSAIGTGVEGFGGLMGRDMALFSNAVQGTYDLSHGGWDSKNTFYEVDPKTGDRKAGKLWRGADLGASFADSMLQFSSKIGQSMYTAQMGMNILGKGLEMTASGGNKFNPYSGQYQSMLFDDDGNFTPGRAAAGVLEFTTDVVQLGMARGLIGNVDATIARVGKKGGTEAAGGLEAAVAKAEAGTRGAMSRALPLWAGGTRGMEAQAAKAYGLKEAEEEVVQATGKHAAQAAGKHAAESTSKLPKWVAADDAAAKKGAELFDPTKLERVQVGSAKYTMNTVTGEAVPGSRRLTIGILAPSEAVNNLAARAYAVRKKMAAQQPTHIITADDLYNAALDLAAPTNKLRKAILNGFGEGAEEGFQNAMDAFSLGRAVDAQAFLEAAAYGFASGAGMSFGALSMMPTEEDQLWHTVHGASLVNPAMARISEKDWAEMSLLDKRREAAKARLDYTRSNAAFEYVVKQQGRAAAKSIAAAHKLRDAAIRQKDSELKKGVDWSAQAIQITFFETMPRVGKDGELLFGEIPLNAAVASFGQTVRNFNSQHKGLREALKIAGKEREALAEAVSNGDEQAIEKDAELQAREQRLELTLEWAKRINDLVDSHGRTLTKLLQEGETEKFNRAVSRLNMDLRNMYDGIQDTRMFKRVSQWHKDMPENLSQQDTEAIQTYVTKIMGRDPMNKSGSFQALVPQVSPHLTEAGQDGVLEVSHAVTQAYGADFDGDKMRLLSMLLADDREFRNIRKGANVVTMKGEIDKRVPEFEATYIELMSEAMNNAPTKASYGIAENTLKNIRFAIRTYLEGYVDSELIEEALKDFSKAVRESDPDARANLNKTLSKFGGEGVADKEDMQLSNVWHHIDEIVIANLQRFQESYVSAKAHAQLMDEGTTNLWDAEKSDPLPRSKKQIRTKALKSGATLMEAIQHGTASSDTFRSFPQIYYTIANAATNEAEFRAEHPANEMIDMYREVQQGLSKTAIETMDEITNIGDRVFEKIKEIAQNAKQVNEELDVLEAIPLIANTAMPDFRADSAGNAEYTGDTITFAQFLLRAEVNRVKSEFRDLSNMPEAQANALARLESITHPDTPTKSKKSKRSTRAKNASKVLVAITENRQMFEILGEAVPPHIAVLTVLQFKRYLRALSDTQKDMEYKTALESPYYVNDTKNYKSGGPIDLATVVEEGSRDKALSGYAILQMAIEDVVNHEVYFDEKDNVQGEIAEKGRRNLAKRADTWRLMRSQVEQYSRNATRSRGESDTEYVQRVIDESDAELSRLLMDYVLDSDAFALFRIEKGGEVIPPEWLYAYVAADNADQAEMIFMINSAIAGLNAKTKKKFKTPAQFLKEKGKHSAEAKEAEAKEEFEDNLKQSEEEEGIEYASLNSRLQQLLYKMHKAKRHDLIAQFVTRSISEKSVDDFYQWLNFHSGFRDGAPFVPGVDDVSEFESNPLSGIWSPKGDSAELSDAVDAMNSYLQTMHDQHLFDEMNEADTIKMASLAANALQHEQDPSVKLQEGATDALVNFRRLRAWAKQAQATLGGRAMMNVTQILIKGMYPDAQTKAVNVDGVGPLATLASTTDTIGFKTNIEKAIDAVTAADLDDLNGNTEEILREGGRVNGPNGALIEWDTLSEEDHLEMFMHTSTRPAALALVTPKVVEINREGKSSVQMIEKLSLKSLMEGSWLYDAIKNPEEKPSLNAALRTLQMVEAAASAYGGRAEVMKIVQYVAAMRIQKQRPNMTDAEIEKMSAEVIQDVARFMVAGGIHSFGYSNGVNKPLGEFGESGDIEITDEFRTFVNELIRERKEEYKFGSSMTKTQKESAKRVFEGFKKSADADRAKEVQAISKEEVAAHGTVTPEGLRKMDLVNARYEILARRMDDLFDPEAGSAIIETYTMVDETDPGAEETNALVRQAIVEFVRNNERLITRVIEAQDQIKWINSIPKDVVFADLKEWKMIDWDLAGRSIIGYLWANPDEVSETSQIVAAYPGSKKNHLRPYYDKSYASVIDMILNPDGAVFKGILDTLHMARILDSGTVDDVAIRKIVQESLFDDKKIGSWNQSVIYRMTESTNRIGAADAAPGVEKAGLIPRSANSGMAAARRTYADTSADMVSSVTLTAEDLTATDLLNTAVVANVAARTPEGDVFTSPQARPLADINSRFMSSMEVHATRKNGEALAPEDLEEIFRHVGVTHRGVVGSSQGGLSVASLDRIWYAVKRFMQREATRAKDLKDPSYEVDLQSLRVELLYLDMDTQPDGAEWYNNTNFEGLVGEAAGDNYSSLPGALMYMADGILDSQYKLAMDAAKYGLPATQPFERPSLDHVKAMEGDFRTNLAQVLRRKTTWVMSRDSELDEAGKPKKGSRSPSEYNAVHKMLKMRHFVRGVNETGEVELWPAEKVIAWQTSHNHEELPLQDAQLYTASQRTLNTILGEQSAFGLKDIYVDFDPIKPQDIPRWSGDVSDISETIPSALDMSTHTINEWVPRLSSVRKYASNATIRTNEDARTYRDYIRGLDTLRAEGAAARSRKKQLGGSEYSPSRNLEQWVNFAGDALQVEDMARILRSLGLPFAPAEANSSFITHKALEDLKSVQDPDHNRAGFIVTYDGTTDYNTGQVNAGTLPVLLRSEDIALRMYYKDTAVVDLGTFRGEKARKAAHEVTKALVNRGVNVVFSMSSSNGDLRRELVEEVLMPHNYKRAAAANNLYMLEETDTRYANDLAAASNDWEVRTVNRQNMSLVFIAENTSIEEGGARLFDGPHLKQVTVRRENKITTNAFERFNLPGGNTVREYDYNVTSVARRIADLRDNPDALKLILEAANSHIKSKKRRKEADADYIAAIDRLLNRVEESPTEIVPSKQRPLEIGDIIPLVDAQQRIFLYRFGYELPQDMAEANALFNYEPFNDGKPFGFATSKTKRDENTTANPGLVDRINWAGGTGFNIVTNVPLSDLGDKEQGDRTAWKSVNTPMSARERARYPDAQPFAGMPLTHEVDTKSTLAKFVRENVMVGMQQAMTLFSWDALPLITEVFFKGEGNNPRHQAFVKTVLNQIATKAERIEQSEYKAAMAVMHMSPYMLDMLPEIAPAAGLEIDFKKLLSEDVSLEHYTAIVSIMYLMTPFAHVDHILRSGALHDDSGLDTDVSVVPPNAFADMFDRLAGTKAHDQLISMFASELEHVVLEDGTKPEGWYLLPDLRVVAIHNGKATYGRLAYLNWSSAGAMNPEIHLQAYDPDSKSQYSQFYANIAEHSTGMEALLSSEMKKYRNAKSRKDVVDFDEGTGADALWKVFDKISGVDPTFEPWRQNIPMEVWASKQNKEWMAEFRHPIDTENEDLGWDSQHNNRRKFKDKVKRIIDELNLDSGDQYMVHMWVRQMMGVWRGEDNEGTMRDPMSADDALLGADLILSNIQAGFMPLVGAFVPEMHVMDLRRIHRANEHAVHPWRPKVDSKLSDKGRAESWEDWVLISLSTPYMSNSPFDAYYRSATDGFMQTYVNSMDLITDLPVSKDLLVQAKLWSEDYNRALVSLDPRVDRAATENYLIEAYRPSIDDFIYGRDVGGRFNDAFPPADQRRKRLSRALQQRKDTGTPIQVKQSFTNMREIGGKFVEDSTNVHNFTQMVLNLRLGTTLLNPALFISMGPEQWVRAMLDTTVNLLSGTATYGTAARTAARISDAVEASNNGFLKTIQDVFGLKPEHTLKTLKEIAVTVELVGRDKNFRHMLYEDLEFIKPTEGVSLPGRTLGKLAKLGALFQDPTRGVRLTTVANRYANAVINEIMQNPTANVGDLGYLMEEWARDKEFFRKHFPSAHNAGIRRIEEMRSVRQTTLSTGIGAFIDPWADSSYPIANMFGNLVLRMPLMFKNYGSNVLVNITGMQGLDAMLAVMLHGRRKGPNGIFGKRSAQIQGNQELYDAANDTIDMSKVLEGLDIGREFMKSGVTLTGLFIMGAMAGGFGLSGEDKEAKLRRKLAETQGMPNVRDPRDPANSFLNADMVFVDSLPPWLSWIGAMLPKSEEGRAFGELHWILKQFISPIIGMERFFETGDFNEVIYGFEDAATSYPLINTQMWWQASETARTLLAEARDEEAKGTDEGVLKATRLLAMVVGTYENMLFENSFVNQIYIGRDEYDRDPYAKPLTSADNNLQYDALGNVRPDKRTLRTYMDPDTGELKRGYVSQSERETSIKTLTENRFTAALVMSLLNFETLGSSAYNRYNMPVKTRTQELPEMTPEEAAAHMKLQVLLQMANTDKAQLNATVDEVLPQVREYMYARAKATGAWVTDAEIQAEANRQAGMLGSLEQDMLKGIDESMLTTRQARAVYDGLVKGTLKITDDVIQGISIPMELRNEVVEEWMNELVQEGVDMGLSKSSSMRRMKRLMYGPYDQPNVQGIRDIVYDDRINYKTQTTYAQLNTTYVPGPNGMPWATGASRDGFLGALGLKPLKGQIMPNTDAVTLDRVNNVVNTVTQQNTGWRAVTPLDDTFNIPTEEEIGNKITELLERIADKDFTPTDQYSSDKDGKTSSGWENYGRRGGYRRYSRGGGGGGGGGWPYFIKQNEMPRTMSVYGNTIPFLNTSNPIIRRADIRRERVWSERGRLNQWQ